MGEEFEAFEPLGTRTDSSYSSASSDSTTPLSPDHPLTHTSPTLTSTRALFHRRMARMTIRAQPVMSPGHSARVTEAMALLDSAFRKRYISSYETPSPSPTLLVRKRYRGTSEPILDTNSKEDEIGEEDTDEDGEDKSLDADDEREAIPEGQQQAVLVVETAASEPLGLGYGALRRRELAVEGDQVLSTFEIRQSSRSMPEQHGVKRVPTFRQPILTSWVVPEDSRVYTDIPVYVPPAVPVQTPPSPEWSSGSLPISPSSPIAPSPVASPVATLIATIADHTQHLDAMAPTLFADIDRDVRDLYTRSRAVRDEIFSQRYRLRSLEQEQDRAASTFGALWSPRKNHDLRMQLAEERRERLELVDRVAKMERRHEFREE
ncbi:hypothetical protein Tco_1187606 [Tanacetum coccineum]